MRKWWLEAAVVCVLLTRSLVAAGEAWTFYVESQVWQEWCCQEMGADYGCWSADRFWSWESCGDPNGGFLVIDGQSTFESAACTSDNLAMRQEFVTVQPWVVLASGYYQVRVRYGYGSDLGACTADPTTTGFSGGLNVGGQDLPLGGGMPDSGGNGDLYWLHASVWLDQGDGIYLAIYADLGPDPGLQSMSVACVLIEWDDAVPIEAASWSTVKALY